MGCDSCCGKERSRHQISIHAPQWGATLQSLGISTGALFQSTHPSGVRLDAFWAWWAYVQISIHAPQWGATAFPDRYRFRVDISIHAPQWGATGAATIAGRRTGHFNPRTPVGCDFQLHNAPPLLDTFQSTHPSGVRRIGLSTVFDVPSISIHAPQWGATLSLGRKAMTRGISIHAPQWGATRARVQQRTHTTDFNPRTPVGCDCENGHSIP